MLPLLFQSLLVTSGLARTASFSCSTLSSAGFVFRGQPAAFAHPHQCRHTPNHVRNYWPVVCRSSLTVLSLSSSSSSTKSVDQNSLNARRRELLGRKGPHFFLDREARRIEFGATARLVTELDNDQTSDSQFSSEELISDWLRDEQSFAMSIWRPDLIERKNDNVYRLQLMTLQFVTLSLAPWVDLRMKTVDDSKGNPVFTLQSVDFDPNVKILPGVRISAETLGITIEVAGQLRASADGKGVTGSIAFETQGNLPSAFRLIPDAALKAASDTINQTVVNFAIKSFETGATSNYKKYAKERTG